MSVCVVIGGSGLLGRALCRVLADQCRTIAVSRNPGPGGIAADLTRSGWVADLPQVADVVVWVAQSRRYREFPEGAEDMARVNEVALLDALLWARRVGVRAFVYASTGSVYAEAPGMRVETDPVEASSFYVASKLNGENIARQFSDNMAVTVLRPFGLFGPDRRDGLISGVIGRVAGGQPVHLEGPSGLVITPLGVSDAARLTAELAFSALGPDRWPRFTILNLAGPDALSLRDIALAAGDIVGRSPLFEWIEGPTRSFCADIARLRQVVSGFSFTPFNRALAEMAVATVDPGR